MKLFLGNLERVIALSDCEYDLYIRADTNNIKHRVWFYFSVENARNNQVGRKFDIFLIKRNLQRVTFHVRNFTKRGSLFETALAAPVVRTSKAPHW
jgi:hypothetical protein